MLAVSVFLQAEQAKLVEQLQAAEERSTALQAAQQAAEQQLAVYKAISARRDLATAMGKAASAAADGCADAVPQLQLELCTQAEQQHVQPRNSKDRTVQRGKAETTEPAPDAQAPAAAGADAAAAMGHDTEGQPDSEFALGAEGDDLPATQAEAWAVAGAIAAATQGGSEDTGAGDNEQQQEEEEEEEPLPSQPAKLSTAAKLQRSKPQVQQQGKRGQRGAAPAAGGGNSKHKAAGRSSAEPAAAAPTQLAFKTPRPRTEPEPWAKKGAVTGTTGATAAAG